MCTPSFANGTVNGIGISMMDILKPYCGNNATLYPVVLLAPLLRHLYNIVPLLIVYAFINRHYILDLVPEVSVVRNLLKQGFVVRW